VKGSIDFAGIVVATVAQIRDVYVCSLMGQIDSIFQPVDKAIIITSAVMRSIVKHMFEKSSATPSWVESCRR